MVKLSKLTSMLSAPKTSIRHDSLPRLSLKRSTTVRPTKVRESESGFTLLNGMLMGITYPKGLTETA